MRARCVGVADGRGYGLRPRFGDPETLRCGVVRSAPRGRNRPSDGGMRPRRRSDAAGRGVAELGSGRSPAALGAAPTAAGGNRWPLRGGGPYRVQGFHRQEVKAAHGGGHRPHRPHRPRGCSRTAEVWRRGAVRCGWRSQRAFPTRVIPRVCGAREGVGVPGREAGSRCWRLWGEPWAQRCSRREVVGEWSAPPLSVRVTGRASVPFSPATSLRWSPIGSGGNSPPPRAQWAGGGGASH